MDSSHQRQVEDDTVVVGSEPGCAVSAAAYRQIQACVAGEVHPGNDIGDLLRLDDGPRVPIEHAVVDGAEFVVTRILRRDDWCPDLLTKLIDRWRAHLDLPSCPDGTDSQPLGVTASQRFSRDASDRTEQFEPAQALAVGISQRCMPRSNAAPWADRTGRL